MTNARSATLPREEIAGVASALAEMFDGTDSRFHVVFRKLAVLDRLLRSELEAMGDGPFDALAFEAQDGLCELTRDAAEALVALNEQATALSHRLHVLADPEHAGAKGGVR
jgi:hypothetical protein